MDNRNLIRFLKKELNIQELHEGNGDWIRAACPTHPETRPSWGIYAGAEHHPTKCFVCGVSSLLGVTMKALDLSFNDARTLLTRYGWVGEGYSKTELNNLKFSTYENRIPQQNKSIIPIYMIAPYEGKYLNIVRRRYNYTNDYLRELRLGADSVNHRVVVPWFSGDNLVGVTGRHIKRNPFPEPKTLPYFDFKKGDHLYLPTRKIIKNKPFILLEGEGDAINVNRVYSNTGAVGTASVTKRQKDLLISHGITDIIVIRDPDEAGKVFAETVRKIFTEALCKVHVVSHPFKDAGEMLLMELRKKLKDLVCLN